jgi:CBS domain-containing protein
MKIEHVIARKGRGVFTLPSNASVGEAMRVLAENNIGAVVIADAAGGPIGILSERDLIRNAAAGTLRDDAPVSAVMSSPIVTGAPGDDVEAVLRTMTDRHFRHLPVVDEGSLVGVVSLGDLVKAQLQQMKGTVENLEAQLMESE